MNIMSTITYSFIIPHKNCPDLLQRCVNSIPRRDDVQIIVVDDDSDPTIVNWNEFQFDDDKCIELVLTKGGQGAGAARNEGLKRAVGKWILFADSDDFYVDGFLGILDKFKDKDLDVLYFCLESIDNLTHKHSKVYDDIRSLYDSYSDNPSVIERIRFLNSPVMKMTSKQLIDKYKISFEDVILGNDLWYSYQVGYYANKIEVINDRLYMYCINSNSTTFHRTVAKDVVQIETYVKQNSFFNYIGHPEWHHNLPGWIKYHWLKSNHKVKYSVALLKNAWRIYKVRNKYVDGIRNNNTQLN